MTFCITTTSTWDPKEILEKYPCLSDYYFKVEEERCYVRFMDVPHIMELMYRTGHSVVLKLGTADNNYIPTIEIYDDWRE